MSSSTSIFVAPSHTRLVAIAAHVDHGKTSLTDNLIEHNGLISERLAGTIRYLDSDPEEQRRGITMHSSAIGLQHTYTAHTGSGNSKKNNNNNNNKAEPQKMIVHLLDSPGHTDFSMEVSSALTACDACLLILDAVEGMAPRTHQVFRETFLHKLVPVLVINKIDRLCTELMLTPTEAYVRLRTLLESVNAAAAAMLTSAAQNQPQQQPEQTASSSVKDSDDSYAEYWAFEPAKGNVVFASALFGWGFTTQSLARSLFRQSILPLKPVILKQCLFSDGYFKDNKLLKWKADNNPSNAVPLFAEYALQPLWTIYHAVAGAAAKNKDKTVKLLRANDASSQDVLDALQTGSTSQQQQQQQQTTAVVPTNMDELQRILTKTGAVSPEAVLRAILRRYRPLAPCLMDVICEYCPSPEQAAMSVRSSVLSMQQSSQQQERQQQQRDGDTNNDDNDDNSNGEVLSAIQKSVQSCDASPDAPACAYVCRFMATDRAHIRDPRLPEGSSNVILGMARVVSGCLRTDNSYHLLGPKHQHNGTTAPMQRTVRLYLIMGSSYILVDQVPAGHLCAIYNLEGVPYKTLTLCDSPHAMPLRGLGLGRLRPLVKVNVEPENAADTDVLERGLVKLSLADAAVEVTSTAKGERILACLGELHLEKSILDLERVYCGKEIKVVISDPIVDFGETTSWFDDREIDDYVAFFDDTTTPPLRQMVTAPYNEEEGLAHARRGRTRAILSGRGAAISLRVVPLATFVHASLKARNVVENSGDELIKLGRCLGLGSSGDTDFTPETILDQIQRLLCSVDSNGNALIEGPGLLSGKCVKGGLSVSGEIYMPKKRQDKDRGEHHETGCDLEGESKDETESRMRYESLMSCIRNVGSPGEESSSPVDEAALRIWKQNMKGSAVAGFQMALRAGWICEEPVRNVLVILEGVEVALAASGNGAYNEETGYEAAKPLSGGLVVSALRTGIRCALLSRPARLVEGHLRLTLHASLAGLGALYSVLSKRRGKVIDDSMVDGADLLLITALIPQAESFGLAPELLRKTSGGVTAPELIFSHWEMLDVDPFWIPTSLEEREDFGEVQQVGDASFGIDNTALQYIRKVRERKGLIVDSSRTIVAAEKQRTLKR